MVTIKTATKLTDIDGNETPTTVGIFLSEILWMSRENHQRSGDLSKKFRKDKEVELKAEDIEFIKKLMGTVGARAGEVSQVLELFTVKSK